MPSHAQANAASFTVYTEHNPPHSYVDPIDGAIRGRVIDLAAAAAKQAGLKVSFQALPWNRLLRTIEEDPKACITPYYRTTPDINKFRWLGPLFRDQLSFYQAAQTGPAPDPVPSMDSLTNAPLVALATSAQSAFLEKVEAPNVIYVDDDQAGLRLLRSGRARYWLTSETDARLAAKTLGVTKPIAVRHWQSLTTYIACHKDFDPILADLMNQAFSRLDILRVNLRQRYEGGSVSMNGKVKTPAGDIQRGSFSARHTPNDGS